MVAGALLLAPFIQGGAARDAHAQTGGCFWPAPHPRCSSWVIAEAGMYTRLTGRQLSDETQLYSITVGWMRNVGPRSAWGGELFLGGDDFRGGVAVRTRRWLSPRVAVDASAGVHLFGQASGGELKRGSPRLAARITYADNVAAVARLEILGLRGRYGFPDATSTRLYLGVELGKKPGAVAVGLAALVGLYAASLNN